MKKGLKSLLKIFIVLIWILIFYLQFERPFIAHIVQKLSPSLLISSLFYEICWIFWISIPFLLFAIIKGRFFCWNICPIGLIQDVIPSIGKAKKSKINMYIFLSLLVASLSGINLLAIFDPLVSFNRAVISIALSIGESLIFLSILLFIILLNVYKKRFWCLRICPLGALFDWIDLIKKRGQFDINKRKTLIAIGTGIAMGLLFKSKKLWTGQIDERLLRPPGALPENNFIDRCIRCGSCISVCLTGTLTPSFLETGILGIFTPRLIPQNAECDEFCNKCGQACPTHAIKNLPLNVKRNFKIGTARIDRSKCIAWSYNVLCLVCQEYCPYVAIEVVKNKNGIPSPKEIPEICRGCGHCEKNCPARPTRAIKVYNKGAGEIINV